MVMNPMAESKKNQQIQLSSVSFLRFYVKSNSNVEKRRHTSKLPFATDIPSYRASAQKHKIIIFHPPSRFGNHSLSAIPRKEEINIIYIISYISSSRKFCKTTFFQHKPNLLAISNLSNHHPKLAAKQKKIDSNLHSLHWIPRSPTSYPHSSASGSTARMKWIKSLLQAADREKENDPPNLHEDMFHVNLQGCIGAPFHPTLSRSARLAHPCRWIIAPFTSLSFPKAAPGRYMGVSWNGGTQQPWVFLQKMIILGCFGGTTI